MEENKSATTKWLLPGSQTLFLGIIAIIGIFAVLGRMERVLVPVTFAWLVFSMLSPIAGWLKKKHVPHSLACALTIAFAVFIFYRAGLFFGDVINSFASKYSSYLDKVSGLVGVINTKLPSTAQEILASTDWQAKVAKLVVSLPGGFLSIFSSVVMVLIIASFMLWGDSNIEKILPAAFPNQYGAKIARIVGGITRQVSMYLILQFVISATTGLCVWGFLALLGIDFARTWGVLAFVLNFIPTIGSIIASIPPIVTAFAQYAPDSYWPAIVTAFGLLCIQFVIGNIISPQVMGNKLNLSAVTVMISLLFWSWLWGIPGAFLSTPITAAIKIICENIGALTPISKILGTGGK